MTCSFCGGAISVMSLWPFGQLPLTFCTVCLLVYICHAGTVRPCRPPPYAMVMEPLVFFPPPSLSFCSRRRSISPLVSGQTTLLLMLLHRRRRSALFFFVRPANPPSSPQRASAQTDVSRVCMYVCTYVYAEASFLVAFEKGKEYTVVKDAFEGGLDVRPCPVAAPLGGKEEKKRKKMQLATFFRLLHRLHFVRQKRTAGFRALLRENDPFTFLPVPICTYNVDAL